MKNKILEILNNNVTESKNDYNKIHEKDFDNLANELLEAINYMEKKKKALELLANLCKENLKYTEIVEVLKEALIIHGVNTSFASGKKAIINGNISRHGFNIGEEVTIVKTGPSGKWEAFNDKKETWWIDFLDAYVC